MFSRLKVFFGSKLVVLMIVPLLFLVVGIMTLPDYGINWDSFVHFSRGQSYFNFFLTGKKNYNDFPPLVYSNCNSGNLGLLLPSCPENNYRRSYYQNDYYNFEYYIKDDSGHPPLNDILATLTNYIFYQKLGILGDTISYHLFIIFAGFALVLAVAYFVNGELGLFPAIVSSIVLASYPLFFSESHFNIKDPVETSFFGLTLIFLYWGIIKNKWQFILISSVAAGLALGTKLNIVFAVTIVTPWLIFYFLSQLLPSFNFKKIIRFVETRKMIFISAIIYLPICLGLVYILWPYLWQDPVRNIFHILDYYTQIGTGTPAEVSKYIIGKWNFYPIYWILVTTTLPILFLSISGLLSFSYFRKLRRTGFYIFILFWLLVPIVRASWPNADIYGGVRQIMEYIPAVAIFAGMGAFFVIAVVRNYGAKWVKLTYFVIVLGLLFSIYEIARIHPNENVYFNQLVGGLRGASTRDIPYWGNTYGSVYLQGIRWINEHAEKESKIALPVGVMSNIPRTMFRPDIDFTKPYWSGLNREGEYGIEMYFEWPIKYWYSFQYYDQYLEPVFVYAVDGVPLLKIWKNDLQHTKPQFKEESVYVPENIEVEKNILGSDIKIDMGKELYITRFTVKHDNYGCKNGLLGYVALSEDGKIWKQEVEPITMPQVAPGVDGKIIGWNDKNFVYLFAGKKARYIMLDPQTGNSCLFRNFEVKVYGLKILP